MNLWAGRNWYRKTFTLPDSMRGKKVFIEFGAAEVYLNGKLLGTGKTGFIPFGFDLTPGLRFGGAKSAIAVMADNTFTQGTGMAKIIKTDLPRNNVYLRVADPLQISLPLYSFLQTAGPYVYASEYRTRARVQVTVDVLGEDGKPVAQ